MTIQSQIAELRQFALGNGWVLVDVYKDDGWSGSMMARPDLDRLRDDAHHKKFDAVLINDVDRLARDVTHLGVIKRDLERNGTRVIFRKLPSESSPTHNLMVNVLGSFAEFERELISDRTRRGRRHKVETRQQFIGCKPAYGYAYIPKDRVNGKEGELRIRPEEASIVSDIFRWVEAEGVSARQVVQRLNGLGIRPRGGASTWGKSTVLRILHSEIYAGVWHYNKFQQCEPKKRKSQSRYSRSLKTSLKQRPRSEWIPVKLPEHLQIVTREQWERVQKVLRRNSAFSPRNSKHHYLLSGLLRCGACLSSYVGEPCHGLFSYRCMARCKKLPQISETILNSVVWEAFEEAISNPDLIAQYLDRLEIELSFQVEKSRPSTEDVVTQLGAEETRLIEAYRIGVLSAVKLGQELAKLEGRRAALNGGNQHDKRQEKPDFAMIRRALPQYCAIARQRLSGLGFDQRRGLLRQLIREIVFEGNQIRIRAVFPMPGTPPGKAPSLDEAIKACEPTKNPTGSETGTRPDWDHKDRMLWAQSVEITDGLGTQDNRNLPKVEISMIKEFAVTRHPNKFATVGQRPVVLHRIHMSA